MSTVASTPTPAALPHVAAGLAGPMHDERPAYQYAGGGRFLPANDAAWREVEQWNRYADAWNARTASRSARP